MGIACWRDLAGLVRGQGECMTELYQPCPACNGTGVVASLECPQCQPLWVVPVGVTLEQLRSLRVVAPEPIHEKIYDMRERGKGY